MLTVETVDEPAPVKYVLITPEKVKKIIDSHVLHGDVVKEFALAVGSERTR
jgi:(2Fe-2S) ferredoxin